MGGSAWQDIVAGAWESQGFGATSYAREWVAPWAAGGHFHCGIDLACAHRAPVRATRSGIVVAVGINYLGDQAVGIRNDPIPWAGEGVTFAEYGHCDQSLARLGDRVRAGQVIALADSRGASSGDHVHLEVRTDGPLQGIADHAAAVLDPWSYLKVREVLMTNSDKLSRVREWWVAGVYRQPGTVEDLNAWAAAIKDDGSNLEEVAQSVLDSPEALAKRAILEKLWANGGSFGTAGPVPAHSHAGTAAVSVT